MYTMPDADGGGDIFDCIQRGNIQQCVELIKNDRSILKEKGNMTTLKWKGITVLWETVVELSIPLYLLFSLLICCGCSVQGFTIIQ